MENRSKEKILNRRILNDYNTLKELFNILNYQKNANHYNSEISELAIYRNHIGDYHNCHQIAFNQ